MYFYEFVGCKYCRYKNILSNDSKIYRYTFSLVSLVPKSNLNSHVIVYEPALPQIIITLRSLLPSSTSSKQWCANFRCALDVSNICLQSEAEPSVTTAVSATADNVKAFVAGGFGGVCAVLVGELELDSLCSWIPRSSLLRYRSPIRFDQNAFTNCTVWYIHRSNRCSEEDTSKRWRFRVRSFFDRQLKPLKTYKQQSLSRHRAPSLGCNADICCVILGAMDQ